MAEVPASASQAAAAGLGIVPQQPQSFIDESLNDDELSQALDNHSTPPNPLALAGPVASTTAEQQRASISPGLRPADPVPSSADESTPLAASPGLGSAGIATDGTAAADVTLTFDQQGQHSNTPVPLNTQAGGTTTSASEESLSGAGSPRPSPAAVTNPEDAAANSSPAVSPECEGTSESTSSGSAANDIAGPSEQPKDVEVTGASAEKDSDHPNTPAASAAAAAPDHWVKDHATRLYQYCRSLSDHVIGPGNPAYSPHFTGSLVSGWQPEDYRMRHPLSLLWLSDDRAAKVRRNDSTLPPYAQDLPMLPHLVISGEGDGHCLIRALLLGASCHLGQEAPASSMKPCHVSEYNNLLEQISNLPRDPLWGTVLPEAQPKEKEIITAYRQMLVTLGEQLVVPSARIKSWSECAEAIKAGHAPPVDSTLQVVRQIHGYETSTVTYDLEHPKLISDRTFPKGVLVVEESSDRQHPTSASRVLVLQYLSDTRTLQAGAPTALTDSATCGHCETVFPAPQYLTTGVDHPMYPLQPTVWIPFAPVPEVQHFVTPFHAGIIHASPGAAAWESVGPATVMAAGSRPGMVHVPDPEVQDKHPWVPDCFMRRGDVVSYLDGGSGATESVGVVLLTYVRMSGGVGREFMASNRRAFTQKSPDTNNKNCFDAATMQPALDAIDALPTRGPTPFVAIAPLDKDTLKVVRDSGKRSAALHVPVQWVTKVWERRTLETYSACKVQRKIELNHQTSWDDPQQVSLLSPASVSELRKAIDSRPWISAVEDFISRTVRTLLAARTGSPQAMSKGQCVTAFLRSMQPEDQAHCQEGFGKHVDTLLKARGSINCVSKSLHRDGMNYIKALEHMQAHANDSAPAAAGSARSTRPPREAKGSAVHMIQGSADSESDSDSDAKSKHVAQATKGGKGSTGSGKATPAAAAAASKSAKPSDKGSESDSAGSGSEEDSDGSDEDEQDTSSHSSEEISDPTIAKELALYNQLSDVFSSEDLAPFSSQVYSSWADSDADYPDLRAPEETFRGLMESWRKEQWKGVRADKSLMAYLKSACKAKKAPAAVVVDPSFLKIFSDRRSSKKATSQTIDVWMYNEHNRPSSRHGSVWHMHKTGLWYDRQHPAHALRTPEEEKQFIALSSALRLVNIKSYCARIRDTKTVKSKPPSRVSGTKRKSVHVASDEESEAEQPPSGPQAVGRARESKGQSHVGKKPKLSKTPVQSQPASSKGGTKRKSAAAAAAAQASSEDEERSDEAEEEDDGDDEEEEAVEEPKALPAKKHRVTGPISVPEAVAAQKGSATRNLKKSSTPSQPAESLKQRVIAATLRQKAARDQLKKQARAKHQDDRGGSDSGASGDEAKAVASSQSTPSTQSGGKKRTSGAAVSRSSGNLRGQLSSAAVGRVPAGTLPAGLAPAAGVLTPAVSMPTRATGTASASRTRSSQGTVPASTGSDVPASATNQGAASSDQAKFIASMLQTQADLAAHMARLQNGLTAVQTQVAQERASSSVSVSAIEVLSKNIEHLTTAWTSGACKPTGAPGSGGSSASGGSGGSSGSSSTSSSSGTSQSSGSTSGSSASESGQGSLTDSGSSSASGPPAKKSHKKKKASATPAVVVQRTQQANADEELYFDTGTSARATKIVVPFELLKGLTVAAAAGATAVAPPTGRPRSPTPPPQSMYDNQYQAAIAALHMQMQMQRGSSAGAHGRLAHSHMQPRGPPPAMGRASSAHLTAAMAPQLHYQAHAYSDDHVPSDQSTSLQNMVAGLMMMGQQVNAAAAQGQGHRGGRFM